MVTTTTSTRARTVMKRAALAAYASSVAIALGAGPSTASAASHTPRAHGHALTQPIRRATTIAVAPSQIAGSLGVLENIPQTLNNCGPASVAEVLAYWGIQRTQDETAAVLRADGNPFGMSPYAIPSYARGLGLEALVAPEGTPRLVKALISNGFPVIVSQRVSLEDHYQHYRPIEAYDDRQGVFISSDPYMGPGYSIPYAAFSQIWTTSNGRFVALYPPAKASLLKAVLFSAGWNAGQAFARDIAVTEHRMRHPEQNNSAWGNSAALHWGGARSYPYLTLAWDNLQLRRLSTARANLQQAVRHGASSLTISWINGEFPVRYTG